MQAKLSVNDAYIEFILVYNYKKIEIRKYMCNTFACRTGGWIIQCLFNSVEILTLQIGTCMHTL